MYYSGLLKAVPTLLGVVGAIFLLGGCASDADEGSLSDEINGGPTPRTVCFAGRTFGDVMTSGGIAEIGRLCKAMPNVIRDVPGGRDAPYDFFQWDSNLAHEMDAIVTALDTNHDGQVTSADAAVTLTVVGYSWGGYNAVDFINAVASDRRFGADRKQVAKFFALDAFRTDYLIVPRARMDVPANVQKFYSFRHTVAPADDCSIILGGLLGPFTGRVPYCTGSTECHDYDFSRADATKNVDHCAVPDAAHDDVVEINSGAPPTALPPESKVAHY